MNERILRTADRLFYLKGIRAIGVDTIAAEIGISKRTLYNHFPSKDALIQAYLQRRFVVTRPSERPSIARTLEPGRGPRPGHLPRPRPPALARRQSGRPRCR